MFFISPPVESWTDPGPFPYSRLRRWAIGPRFEPEKSWLEQRQAHFTRLAAETEDLERLLAAQAEYDRLIAEYQTEGQHMADWLPVYLHNLKLSYRRTVQDRKTERHYERVDYCKVETWYFDESAFYFQVNTWNAFPYGLSKQAFLDPAIADTLSLNYHSEVFIEVNPPDHDRFGLWIVVMHKAGKGLVPKLVPYADMLKAMPKSAPALAFPVGRGKNGRLYYGDMDELITILVVGSKGAGKSNFINCLLNTWLNRVGPETLRLFLTDLKGGLEFYDYHGIPHLGGDVDIKMRLDSDGPREPVRMGQEIMTDPHQVIPALKYIEAEMNRRFEIMKGKAKKITAYNRKFKSQLSYWVLVVDELATLMDSSYKNDAASLLGEIARKGRAVGIYMILATQIPDKSVLTRQVAGNMDCRIVGRLADGPSSALSLGDGSWDAVYLPKDVPGRVIWRWSDKVIVQAPLIPDMAVKQTVKALRDGELTSPALAAENASAMEIFFYVFDSLGGLCNIRELYQHFRNRMSKHSIMKILKAWESSPNKLIPIQINDDDYYLAPSTITPDGKTPRQLVKQEELLALFQVPSFNSNGKQVTDRDSKPAKVERVEAFEAPPSVLDDMPAEPVDQWTTEPMDDMGDSPNSDIWESPDWLDSRKRPRRNGRSGIEELAEEPAILDPERI